MITAIWVVGGLVGVLAVLMLVLAFLGARLPREHVASMSLRLTQTPPEGVWALIADGAGFASWAWGVKRAEKLPEREGRETTLQTIGRYKVVFETVRSEPPRSWCAGSPTRALRSRGVGPTRFGPRAAGAL
ncbi:MAG: SRPBCC family protein [Phycisphaerales bacterium]